MIAFTKGAIVKVDEKRSIQKQQEEEEKGKALRRLLSSPSHVLLRNQAAPLLYRLGSKNCGRWGPRGSS